MICRAGHKAARWERPGDHHPQANSAGSFHPEGVRSEVVVGMAEHFAQNPGIIVNGFLRAGITGALDHSSNNSEDDQSDSDCTKSESDFEVEDED